MVAAPIDAAVEQADTVYRIGWLTLGSCAASDPNLANFRSGLSELGWIEGRNIAIVARCAESQSDRLPILAAELVALKVNVIVTVTTPAALAAKETTALIPIVMAGGSDPVERGLVKSLARPGGNITGLTNNPGPGLYPKMLQLLKDAAPRVSRVAVLWTTGLQMEEATFKEIQVAAPPLGITVIDAGAGKPEQVPVALAGAVRAGTNGLIVTPTPFNYTQMKVIVDFAMTNRLPSIFGEDDSVTAGGLMSYWTSWGDLRRRSAGYVDKILKGAEPGDLPVEQPTKFALVINLKTAKALGLTIPQSLLSRADELIK
jgi:ABC-type uncharacterized transport system substrate-binding protein